MTTPTFELRPLQIPADIPTIHDWVRRDYARFWGMQGLDEAGVRAGYEAILEPPDVEVFLARHAGEPAFLVECYEPARGPLATHYDAQSGDRGMHLLVAPPPTDASRRISGFTRAAFRTVLEHLFADPEASRIVVEPDIRNSKIRELNLAFGFREVATVELVATATTPAKTAVLSFCTREDFARARLAQERS